MGSGGITPIIPKTTLEGCNYLHASAPLTLRKVPQYPLTDRMGGSQSWCRCFREKQPCGPATQFLSSPSLQIIQCTDYNIYTAWEELNEVFIITNCMLKKLTFLSTCLTPLKLMCSVNFSMTILLDHCILQNTLLKKIFKLTKYNSLFSYKLKITIKFYLFSNRMASYPHGSHKVTCALNVMFSGLMGWVNQQPGL